MTGGYARAGRRAVFLREFLENRWEISEGVRNYLCLGSTDPHCQHHTIKIIRTTSHPQPLHQVPQHQHLPRLNARILPTTTTHVTPIHPLHPPKHLLHPITLPQRPSILPPNAPAHAHQPCAEHPDANHHPHAPQATSPPPLPATTTYPDTHTTCHPPTTPHHPLPHCHEPSTTHSANDPRPHTHHPTPTTPTIHQHHRLHMRTYPTYL